MSLNFLVIGAGSRGTAYARAVAVTSDGSTNDESSTSVLPARIAAVTEPDPFKRADFGRKFIWGKESSRSDGEEGGNGKSKRGQEFVGWKEWIAWEDARRLQVAEKEKQSGVAGTGNNDHLDPDVVITGVFVCTLDESHVEILHALEHLDLHVLCEKPLALSLEDCLSIKVAYSSVDISPSLFPQHHDTNTTLQQKSLNQHKIFSIGHVLRYSPHNTLLRRLLLQDRVIGDVISLEHTEPVGWWHFAHAYVRGNWRHTTPGGVGTLLTKSCHDIDFIMWLLCSPADVTDERATPHLPATISSSGALSYFRRARKPSTAGEATNCLSCPLGEEGCVFSAKKIYRDKWLREEKDTGWPLKIVVPEMEDLVSSASSSEEGWEKAEAVLMQKLGEDYDTTDPTGMEVKRVKERGWYGRCVYESDNDVVDDQTVTMTWNEEPDPSSANHPDGQDYETRGPKTAIFHLTYATQAQCDRRGRIYGSKGEIEYDSKKISVYTFADEKVVQHILPKPSSIERKSHGGGDVGLAKSFIDAVRACESGDMTADEAQKKFVGGDLEEIVRSHAVVFAAEEARREGKVLDFQKWWRDQQCRRSMAHAQEQQELMRLQDKASSEELERKRKRKRNGDVDGDGMEGVDAERGGKMEVHSSGDVLFS